MPDSPPQRAPRKDAARNRSRLIEAAAHAFREEGLGVSVNAIADHAGVNVATLYRHFPTKDHLIVAVLETVLEPLLTARERALTTHESGDVLATFANEAVRLQAMHRGLADALEYSPSATELRAQLRGPAIDIVTPVVELAHRTGELRSDIDARDLLVLLRMVAGVAAAPEVSPDRVRRYVDLLLRGLRPD